MDAADVDSQEDNSIAAERLTVRDEFGIPDKAKIVGMVARVAPAKDFATLARAARHHSPAQRCALLIVGDYLSEAAYREHYRQVKQMLAANDVEQFYLHGFSTGCRQIPSCDGHLCALHAHGRLATCCARSDGARPPVVATAVGGVPEVVLDGQTGLLHQHENDEQLAAKLLSLLNDEPRAARLGETGRRYLQTNFNGAQFAANMTRFYREVLGIKAQDSAGLYAATNSLKQLERN
jgi:glycosyltransferase involved in cell wall biosynthesis